MDGMGRCVRRSRRDQNSRHRQGSLVNVTQGPMKPRTLATAVSAEKFQHQLHLRSRVYTSFYPQKRSPNLILS